MNKLIKIEMERAFKNKMLIISVVIGLVIVGFNIWNEIIPARKTLDKLLEMGKYSGIQLPGLYMKVKADDQSILFASSIAQAGQKSKRIF